MLNDNLTIGTDVRLDQQSMINLGLILTIAGLVIAIGFMMASNARKQ